MVWSRTFRGLTMVRLQPLSPLSVGFCEPDTWGFKCDVVLNAMFNQRGLSDDVTTSAGWPRLTRMRARVREKNQCQCVCLVVIWSLSN